MSLANGRAVCGHEPTAPLMPPEGSSARPETVLPGTSNATAQVESHLLPSPRWLWQVTRDMISTTSALSTASTFPCRWVHMVVPVTALWWTAKATWTASARPSCPWRVQTASLWGAGALVTRSEVRNIAVAERTHRLPHVHRRRTHWCSSSSVAKPIVTRMTTAPALSLAGAVAITSSPSVPKCSVFHALRFNSSEAVSWLDIVLGFIKYKC